MMEELYARARLQEMEREQVKWRLVRAARLETAPAPPGSIKQPLGSRETPVPAQASRSATPPPTPSR